MKKTICGVLILGLLTGCASQQAEPEQQEEAFDLEAFDAEAKRLIESLTEEDIQRLKVDANGLLNE